MHFYIYMQVFLLSAPFTSVHVQLYMFSNVGIILGETIRKLEWCQTLFLVVKNDTSKKLKDDTIVHNLSEESGSLTLFLNSISGISHSDWKSLPRCIFSPLRHSYHNHPHISPGAVWVPACMSEASIATLDVTYTFCLTVMQRRELILKSQDRKAILLGKHEIKQLQICTDKMQQHQRSTYCTCSLLWKYPETWKIQGNEAITNKYNQRPYTERADTQVPTTWLLESPSSLRLVNHRYNVTKGWQCLTIDSTV